MELSKITLAHSVPFSHRAEALRDRLGSALRIVDQLAPVPAARPTNQSVSEKEVRALVRLRRNRGRYFPDGMFADPAWDILLELFAAELGQQRIAIGSLGVAAAVPMTTALRWITSLEKAGLIERRSDPLDGRRSFMSLSRTGLDAMNAYFTTVPVGSPLI